jgi:nicotinate-nucleotide pyrophosphorylase (carboxylating)
MLDLHQFAQIDTAILSALYEDKKNIDITTDAIFDDEIQACGKFIAKADGVIAGLEIVERTFFLVEPSIHFVNKVNEGALVKQFDLIAEVSGAAKGMLIAERTALNFLQRMSGIATLTRKFVDETKETKAKILDTRKTVPNLRYFDKFAVRIGGGENHRMGLYDQFLIKDNHIQVAGSVGKAIEKCLAYRNEIGREYKIEVEVESLDQLEEAIKYPVDIIMLDNFQLDDIRTAVRMIDKKALIEVSGNVSLETVREIALAGVDRISVGALTHSVRALDISLELSIQSK